MSLYLGNNLISGVATPIEGARNIGQIVQSTIPLTDAGLHLLDGSLISGSGAYSDFVTYIAGLVSSYPDLFATESDWQTSVTTYGSCDKYVYDSVNNTVRLSKRTSEHGALIKSYSSGNSWYRIYQDGWCEQGGYIAYLTQQYAQYSLLQSYKDSNYSVYASYAGINGNTSSYSGRYVIPAKPYDNSKFLTALYAANEACYWFACGYTDISDYQYSPVYEYIVIATSTQTQVEVDINEIMTDLNGKADIDLSNINPSAQIKSAISEWGFPSNTYIEISNKNSGSEYVCPARGFVAIQSLYSGNSYIGGYIRNERNEMTAIFAASYGNGGGWLPVEKDDVILLQRGNNQSINYYRFFYLAGEQ